MEQGEKCGDNLRQVIVTVRTESPGLGSFSRTEREDMMDLVKEEMSLGGMVGCHGCCWGEMSLREMMPGMCMCQV